MKQHFRVRCVADALADFRKAWKALEQGRKVKRQTGTYFTSLEAARKILTPRRLELLRAIRRENPESVYRLARLVGRDLKNVSEDVRVLAAHGLIALTKTRGASGRPVTVPRVPFNEIEFRIAV